MSGLFRGITHIPLTMSVLKTLTQNT
jgi:hypothetical protein